VVNPESWLLLSCVVVVAGCSDDPIAVAVLEPRDEVRGSLALYPAGANGDRVDQPYLTIEDIVLPDDEPRATAFYDSTRCDADLRTTPLIGDFGAIQRVDGATVNAFSGSDRSWVAPDVVDAILGKIYVVEQPAAPDGTRGALIACGVLRDN
jgi:hypothetical protein